MSGRSSFLRSLKKLPRNGRTAALHALLLADSGLSAQEALADALSGPLGEGGKAVAVLPQQERHLCSELVYGCLRAEIRIAYLLGRVLPKPERLPLPLRHILELAVYALLFQERVPDHAAVHSAVAQAERLFGRSLARVTNGALRSIQRFGTAVDTREFYVVGKEGALADEWGGLCRYYSLPRWLGDLWHDAYGREAALCLMRRSFARPWSGVRVNARHEAAEELLAGLRHCAKEGCGEAVGRWGVAFAPGELPAHVRLRLCPRT